MSKHVHHEKTMVVLFLIFSVFLSRQAIGSSPPQTWGNSAALEAVLSPDDGKVELSWQPRAGATAYRVFRAPLTNDDRPYAFKLLAELPQGRTFFSDAPEPGSSVVYRVTAVGAGEFTYPLAAKITLNRFGGLVPVSLEFHPNTVQTALASLESYELVKDADTGEHLDGGDGLSAGMVLEVTGYKGKRPVLVGTMPAAAPFRFNPHKYRMFAVPLTFEKANLKVLQGMGLKGAASHSYVYTDGNNRQLPEDVPYSPGGIYGMRLDRGTEIDFIGKKIRQDMPLSRAKQGEPELLGGSPDDGTQVVVLYDDTYKTKLYKCWNSGKSGAWDGITDNAVGADNVKNAAVVRRGCTMYVKDEAGMDETTPVAIYAPSEPGTARQTVSWTVSWDAAKQAAAISIPYFAPVGDYQVQVGGSADNYVTVYIIFDPSFAENCLDANEYRSWVYADDDWQTVPDLKNYLNYVFEGPGYPLGTTPYVYGYRGDSSAESGADGGIFGQRYVEMACSIHGSGAQTPEEACVHAYQVIGQRVTWVSGNGWYGNDSGEYNTFDDTLVGYIEAPSGIETADELDVVTAERAALGLGWNDRLTSNYILDTGACFNFGTCLTAMFRSMGIPARCHHGIGGDGWTASFHVWAEAFLDNPDIHPQDPDWWDSYWYEFDCNDYYLSHSTSHSEGSISPIVIDGFGDYLINEYVQCEGIGYDGSFYDNSFMCTAPGTNTGSHTAVPLESGTTDDAEEDDNTPLVVRYERTDSAWLLMNNFVPWDGPARPSGDAYVYDGHHGYALNDTQTGVDGGSGYIDNAVNEDDLPVLLNGVDQKGVIGGWGWMMYRVPVDGRDTISVYLQAGADKVEVLGTLDRNIYSTDRRWDLDYDFSSDASGVLTANTSGGSQLYLWVQMKGFSHTNPGTGQEVAWYTIRAGDSTPYVNAQFSYTKVSDYVFQFTDESTAYNDTIVSHHWDFGDGSESTDTNPTHTYSSAAYYNVTLTVTGASSAQDSETKQIWAGINQSPTADFTFSADNLTVTFTDTGTDPDGVIVGWYWDFGDGNTSTLQHPVHTYAADGTYTVTLTVTDNDGLTDDTSKPVTVSGPVNIPPAADFTFTTDGLTVIFTDGSSDIDGTIANHSWDFDDGGTSSAVNVGHTFAAAGTYSVSLTVTDNDGGVDSISDDVTVSAESTAPDADFSFEVNGMTVNFSDESRDPDPDGTITSWSWDFGDGGSSTQQNPGYTYASAGTFTVGLTVTDNNGLTDLISGDVTVSGGGELPEYCPSYSESADNMAVSQVVIGSFTNSSGKSTYSDFTAMTINFQTGQSYSTAITMDNSRYNARVVIWIDFNRDGDFDDEGEQVFRKHRKGTVSGTITIPSTGVVTGQKLGLRIHADTFSYRDPCDVNTGTGEVEDYAVIIE
jgi:PKD repeat protein